MQRLRQNALLDISKFTTEQPKIQLKDLYSYTVDQTERNSTVDLNMIFGLINYNRIFFSTIYEYVSFLKLKDIVKLWPHSEL